MRAKPLAPALGRWRRVAAESGIVVAVAVIAAPTALGAKPTRTVMDIDEGFVSPAGFGCAFAIAGQPDEDATAAVTEFSDGRVQTIGHAAPTLTNLETGDSLVHRSRYRSIETFDPETNELTVTVSGRVFFNFFPGDQGPFGEVASPGLLLSVRGHQEFTIDLDTFVVTAYALDGQTADLCPLLSPG